MSSTVTQIGTWSVPSTGYQAIWNEATIQDAVSESREHAGIFSVYTIFISMTVILVLFFATSLVLTITTQYFLEVGSAIIGLLGSTGLALVGWFSKRQFES